MSMPGYVQATLDKFKHEAPRHLQHAPRRHNPIQYGVKVQLTDAPDLSAPLSTDGIKRIQKIVGTLLYYARAVDNTLLVALSSLASRQSKATHLTNRDVSQLLDYCYTHPEATLRYHASDMILKIHSDAGYLNESKARSRAGGHFYLGNKETKPDIDNGAILNPTGILRHVASAASEAEYGALFVNGKEGTIMRNTLDGMGYPQPSTVIVTDNSTADGIANDTIKQQRSRTIDMRYHWIRDRIVQGQFRVQWRPGKDNKGDYFTKHHAGAHHQRVRPQYLAQHCAAQSALTQDCKGVLNSHATSGAHIESSPGSRTPTAHWRPAHARASPRQPATTVRSSFSNSLLKTLSIPLN